MSYQELMPMLEKIEHKFIGFDTEQRVMAERLLELEQKGTARKDDIDTKGGSLGDQVVKAIQTNADLLAKTRNLRFEVKAAGDVITQTSGRNLVSGGVGAPIGMAVGIQNALRQTPASGTSAVEYFRFLATEGAASIQAGEGASKSAVRPTHLAVTQSALTIAAWTKISRQAMSDSAELRQAVDITLRREIGKALDAAIMTVSANPVWTGLVPLATSYTSLVYQNLWDAASEAATTMLTAGFQPDVVALNPADWLAVQTAKNAVTGDYFSGSYLGPLPESLRGLKVVMSPNVTTGKILVLDSGQIELKIVDDFAVEVNYVADDFIKNQTTILGELRVIPIYRAVGAARLITPKA